MATTARSFFLFGLAQGRRDRSAIAKINLRLEGFARFLALTRPVLAGQLALLPIVARFLATFPKVRLDLSLSDEHVRGVKERFDSRFACGMIDDSDLLSRRLASVARRVGTSPAYISAYSGPETIDDLRRHAILVNSPSFDIWTFDTDKGAVDVRVSWRMSAGGMMALAKAAMLGLGIALLPSFLADTAISAGELVLLNVGGTPTPADAIALFPRSGNVSVAVHIAKRKENESMRTAIIFAFALAAAPAVAQPRLDVPVTITATAMTKPLCFFFLCGLALGAVPDGAGGFVSFTNSRDMPDGSLRPYDPAIDGPAPPVYAHPPPPPPPEAFEGDYAPLPPPPSPTHSRPHSSARQWHDPHPVSRDATGHPRLERAELILAHAKAVWHSG